MYLFNHVQFTAVIIIVFSECNAINHRFQLNAHTPRFYPQTQKMKQAYKTLSFRCCSLCYILYNINLFDE